MDIILVIRAIDEIQTKRKQNCHAKSSSTTVNMKQTINLLQVVPPHRMDWFTWQITCQNEIKKTLADSLI